MDNDVKIRRVLIAPNLTVSRRKQKRDYQNIRWDIVFQRGDGWTLAAPAALESEAYESYKDAWVGFARHKDSMFIPIALYGPRVVAERCTVKRMDYEPLLFSQRSLIAALVEEWFASAERSSEGLHTLSRDSFNIVTSLESMGLLDRAACRQALDIRESEEK